MLNNRKPIWQVINAAMFWAVIATTAVAGVYGWIKSVKIVGPEYITNSILWMVGLGLIAGLVGTGYALWRKHRWWPPLVAGALTPVVVAGVMAWTVTGTWYMYVVTTVITSHLLEYTFRIVKAGQDKRERANVANVRHTDPKGEK